MNRSDAPTPALPSKLEERQVSESNENSQDFTTSRSFLGIHPRRSPIDVCRSPAMQGVVAGTFLLSASLFTAWICYSTAYHAFRQAMDEDLLTIARIAALRLDPETHARLTHPEDQHSQDYLSIVTPLREMARVSEDILYIYTLRPTLGGLLFVVDSGAPEDTDRDGIIDQATLGQPYPRGPAGPLSGGNAWSTLCLSGTLYGRLGHLLLRLGSYPSPRRSS